MTFMFRMECSDGNDNTVYDLLVTADNKEAAILAARKSIESQDNATDPTGQWLGQDPDGFQIDFDDSGDNYNIYTLYEDGCQEFTTRESAMAEHAKSTYFHTLWFA